MSGMIGFVWGLPDAWFYGIVGSLCAAVFFFIGWMLLVWYIRARYRRLLRADHGWLMDSASRCRIRAIRRNDRVRVISGVYQGETGTVEDAMRGGFYVRLDGICVKMDKADPKIHAMIWFKRKELEKICTDDSEKGRRRPFRAVRYARSIGTKRR